MLGELSTPEKWARTYLVKPSVLPAAIGPVLVLLSTRTQRGINGVWTTVHAADSAARAVAAAGDSLARAVALDELAARRAALDAAADTLADSTLAFVAGGRDTAAVSVRADSVRLRAGADSGVRPRARGDTARTRPTPPPRVKVPPPAVRP